jgi:hypothetical protein
MKAQMARRLSLIACFLFVGAGCSMRVSGAVVDRATGRPIPGAVVAVDGRQPYVTTDLLGRYSLKTARRPCSIVANAPCYLVGSATVDPTPSRYPTQDVSLERSPECFGGAREADR